MAKTLENRGQAPETTGARPSWMTALADAPKPEFTRDEEAWLGMGSDVEAEQRAARSVAAMVAKTCAVRPFPATATRVIELTSHTERHVREVVRVIETDPTLATRILRYVNSAACGLKVRCKSLYHAVTLLGPRRIRELVTSTAVLSMFERGDTLSTDILEHAAVTGAFARLVGERFGLPSEEMLACGLLHDLGKLMLLDAGDLYYAPLLSIAGDDETLVKLEREQYGFDHAVLAGQMLVKWRIPSPIPRVVAWHHQPGRAHQVGGKIAVMVETLRFADQLADAFQFPREDERREDTVRRIASGSAASYLGIDEYMLARMWPTLDQTQRESRALFHGDEVPLSELAPLDMTPQTPARAEAPPHGAEKQALHCALCNEPTYGAACPACRRPLCDAHDGGLGFCAECEDAFAAEKDTLTTAFTGTLAISAGAATLLIAFSAFADIDLSLALAGAFLGCFVGGAGAGARRFARRRGFHPSYPEETASAPRLKTAVVRAEEFEAPILSALVPDPDGKRVFCAEDLVGLVPRPTPKQPVQELDADATRELRDEGEPVALPGLPTMALPTLETPVVPMRPYLVGPPERSSPTLVPPGALPEPAQYADVRVPRTSQTQVKSSERKGKGKRKLARVG